MKRTAKHVMQQQLVKSLRQVVPKTAADPAIVAAVQRLEEKCSFLLDTGRHGWVRKRARSLGDSSNWAGYAMEVHIAHALETCGLRVASGVKLLPGSKSDVDFVWLCDNGVEVRMECVRLEEPQRFWTQSCQFAPGVKVMTGLQYGEGEATLLRIAQEKIRLKTIGKGGKPVKFPVPEASSVHLIVADVSNSLGWKPDSYDLEEIALGSASALPGWKHRLVGLFESKPPDDDELLPEFERSRFVRERVHLLIFLMDESSWHHPVMADYCAHFVPNPAVAVSKLQSTAVDRLVGPFNKLVTRGWLAHAGSCGVWS